MIKLYFSFLVLSIQFKIKHADKNLYLCKSFSEVNCSLMVPCSNIEEAADFKFDDNGNGTQQVITVDGTKALDTTETGFIVKYCDANKKMTQQFIITNVDSNKYTIKSYGRCMTQNETNYQLENCNNSSSQLFTNVESAKKTQVYVDPKTTVVKPNPIIQKVANSTIQKVTNTTINQTLLNKLQKALDENKKLARKIFKLQKCHSKKDHANLCQHHIHHHHFCDDDEYNAVEKPILTNSEYTAKKYVYPSEAERKSIVKETVPITRRDYAIASSHYTKSINNQRTGPSLFDNLKN